MRLEPTQLTDAELRLREEVRDYLDERLPPGSFQPGLGMIGASDPEFSRDLGRRGWLGMALPTEYGGGGRSAVDRLIVVEELLARGAPVSFHWVADRQSGPSIARFGTEEQKRWFLPRIARGELSFGIGMSEPDAGSDLASLRTSAVEVPGGWRVNGTKIWTTGAYDATHILGLFRTGEDRYGGLTQFIVARETEGFTVSPIPFIDGTSDFCELHFDDAFVPAECRLGEVGAGWSQNTSELVLERGGVDRWMSMVSVLERWAATAAVKQDSHALADLGDMAARHWAFRGMSLSLARMVDDGRMPVIEAALVKEMSTRFEQDCVQLVLRHYGRVPDLHSRDELESLLARALLVGPSWTIRGGTSEILRTIAAKGLIRR